jgi:glycosyltransferase involved in cell wall biosynthesis
MYPEAPIYTAFYNKKSLAYKRLRAVKIIPSFVHFIPFFGSFLVSPLRFLAPFIWNSFDFSKYDVVIGSASWYVTKGFRKGKNTREICYCHTPPRWLYGYQTSTNLQNYWLVKAYSLIVSHFMRIYDYKAAQKVDIFVANSQEVKARIEKFYRRDSVVIYPPVSLPKTKDVPKEDYYFIVARLVGAKGLDLAIEASRRLGFKLKIAGVASSYSGKKLMENLPSSVEFLGRVSDEELSSLYKGAKAFLALSQDEDFGITPVESMLSGTPVIAFYGGGYKETVVEEKTGLFFKEATVESLIAVINKFEKISKSTYSIMQKNCLLQSKKFSKEEFMREFRKII